MRRLKPEECHIYLDGQQYFIGVVLDISRKATAVKGRMVVSKVARALSQRLTIVQHHCCKRPDSLPLFIMVYIIMQAMFGRSTHLQQVAIPKQQPTVQPYDSGVLFLVPYG